MHDFELTYFATSALVPDGNGRLNAALVLDSVLPAPTGLLADAERERARGTRYAGVLTPEGRLADFAGPDSPPAGRMRELAEVMRDFFPRIPAGGVEAGQTWTDTTAETTGTAGTEGVTIRSITVHEVRDSSDYAGERSLEIRTSTRYTLTGEGQQSGQPYSVEGTGVRRASHYLSQAGRYLGRHSIDSATVDVSFTGLGLVIPGHEIRTDTLTAIPG
ncbi:MAG: hypothetical protein HY560_09090 [Gemmatimonadetes bacterium]|nr:hypothetical protein [Gemmatimonadota bacterium]